MTKVPKNTIKNTIKFVCVYRCSFKELSVAEAVLAVEAVVFQLIRFGSVGISSLQNEYLQFAHIVHNDIHHQL